MNERLSKIYKIIESETKVDITNLANRLNIAEITIRRDLKKLEEKGLVTCILRGAMINQESGFRIPYIERMQDNIQEKIEIAEKALSYISPSESIVICNGTTTYQLAKLLRNTKMRLRVFTNALDSAMELAYSNYLTTIITGGQITDTYTIEVSKDNEISNYNGIIDKVFVGGDGISIESGLTSFSMIDSEVNKIMMENAREIIVLIDHTKFNLARYSKILPIDHINKLITDNKLPNSIYKEYRTKGVNLILADSSIK